MRVDTPCHLCLAPAESAQFRGQVVGFGAQITVSLSWPVGRLTLWLSWLVGCLAVSMLQCHIAHMINDPPDSAELCNLWLKRLAERGDWPERPFLSSPEGRELIRLGLVELVTPRAPYPSYATLTEAGHDKWDDGGFK
jgi:hypothetical protein